MGFKVKSFTVLTVSKRYGWEQLAANSLLKQTVQPDKWIVVHEKPSVVSSFQHLYSGYDAELLEAPEQIRASNLNRSLNHGLKQIKTDYVIFYQDFIELAPDCFEKLLELTDDTTFVTTCTPNYNGSDDSRYTGINVPRVCRPEEWESNVAVAPMKIIRELGGFNEELDNGWSWDNCDVAERAAMLGCKFIIDESNRPKLLPHEMTSRLELTLNGERHEKNMAAIRAGHKPLRYNYL